MKTSRAAALGELSPAYDPIVDAVERSSAKVLAFAPVNQACVASDGGYCLACGARQGEACRQPRTGSRR